MLNYRKKILLEAHNKIKENSDNQLSDVEKALDIIQNQVLYVENDDDNYIPVTLEIFYNSYLKEPLDQSKSGIIFGDMVKDNGTFYYTDRYIRPVITVNGDRYYDLKYKLLKYQNKFKHN